MHVGAVTEHHQHLGLAVAVGPHPGAHQRVGGAGHPRQVQAVGAGHGVARHRHAGEGTGLRARHFLRLDHRGGQGAGGVGVAAVAVAETVVEHRVGGRCAGLDDPVHVGAVAGKHVQLLHGLAGGQAAATGPGAFDRRGRRLGRRGGDALQRGGGGHQAVLDRVEQRVAVARGQRRRDLRRQLLQRAGGHRAQGTQGRLARQARGGRRFREAAGQQLRQAIHLGPLAGQRGRFVGHRQEAVVHREPAHVAGDADHAVQQVALGLRQVLGPAAIDLRLQQRGVWRDHRALAGRRRQGVALGDGAVVGIGGGAGRGHGQHRVQRQLGFFGRERELAIGTGGGAGLVGIAGAVVVDVQAHLGIGQRTVQHHAAELRGGRGRRRRRGRVVVTIATAGGQRHHGSRHRGAAQRIEQALFRQVHEDPRVLLVQWVRRRRRPASAARPAAMAARSNQPSAPPPLSPSSASAGAAVTSRKAADTAPGLPSALVPCT